MPNLFQALASTMAAQTSIVAASLVMPIVATAAAADIGLDAKYVGYYTTLVFVSAMAGALFSGPHVQRLGAIRFSQTTLALAALGMAATATAFAPLLALGALAIGVGFGSANPAASELLARAATPARRNLVFSFKQSSVPLGAAMAGVVLPVLVGSFGWRGAVLAAALFLLAVAAALQPWRRGLDAGRQPRARGGFGHAVPTIRLVWRHGALRELALGSMCFSAAQSCFTSFFVPYLAQHQGMTLIRAGSVFTVSLFASVAGRLAWGWVADRLAPRHVLLTLALGVAVAALLVIAMEPDWPYAAVLAVGIGFGTTAISWNGVFLAEVAERAPADRIAQVTGGALVFTYFGAVCGPSVFSALATASGSYLTGFGFVVALGVAPALVFLRRPRHVT
jgi:MFS family permease